MTDEQLSALLRLKRHEQPPPGYFDDLLHAVQRRQREELLQRPLWKMALERMQAFFSEYSLSPVSYGGAFAALMVGGIMAINSLAPQEGSFGSGDNFAMSGGATRGNGYALRLQPAPEPERLLAEYELPAQPGPITHTPRYVIDARPVSYDASYSF